MMAKTRSSYEYDTITKTLLSLKDFNILACASESSPEPNGSLISTHRPLYFHMMIMLHQNLLDRAASLSSKHIFVVVLWLVILHLLQTWSRWGNIAWWRRLSDNEDVFALHTSKLYLFNHMFLSLGKQVSQKPILNWSCVRSIRRPKPLPQTRLRNVQSILFIFVQLIRVD